MNHILVFSELTTGRLQTMLSGKCAYSDILSCVKSVNTKILYKNIVRTESSHITENFNYQALGYKTDDDFLFTTDTAKSPELVNISITPSCYYRLHDDFNLAPAPDKRSKIIQGLLCDEFERIKNRALYFFETSNGSEEIKVYATKNRQFAKTCFHNHKAVFHDLFTLRPDYLRDPDAFIHYNLNFFLIRLRLFYEKLFEDFLGRGKKTEKQLLAELFQMNPAMMYRQNAASPANFDIDSGTQITGTGLQRPDSDTSLTMAFDVIAKAYNLPAENARQIIELLGKFRWNGQTNTLADIFYQVMHELKEYGKPLLESHPDDVATLISLLAIDGKGNFLSKATIRTALQPDKTDKRPKPGSKSKIDVKKIIS